MRHKRLCPALTHGGHPCPKVGWLPHEDKFYCGDHDPLSPRPVEELNRLRDAGGYWGQRKMSDAEAILRVANVCQRKGIPIPDIFEFLK